MHASSCIINLKQQFVAKRHSITSTNKMIMSCVTQVNMIFIINLMKIMQDYIFLNFYGFTRSIIVPFCMKDSIYTFLRSHNQELHLLILSN